ncbi:hypothetical protein PCE1_002421 [Barthelona sp. PCE]
MIYTLALSNRAGNVILSRNTLRKPKFQISTVLTVFPKLLKQSNNSSNVVYGENYSIFYCPLDDIYVLLIADREFNHSEADNALQSIASFIRDYCRVVSTDNITEMGVKICHGIDEYISTGYFNDIPLAEVKAALTMYSYQAEMEHQKTLQRESETKRAMQSRHRDFQTKMKQSILEDMAKGSQFENAYTSYFESQGGISCNSVKKNDSTSGSQSLKTGGITKASVTKDKTESERPNRQQRTELKYDSLVSKSEEGMAPVVINRNPKRGLVLKRTKGTTNKRNTKLLSELANQGVEISMEPDEMTEMTDVTDVSEVKQEEKQSRIRSSFLTLEEKLSCEIHSGSVEKFKISGGISLHIQDEALTHDDAYIALANKPDEMFSVRCKKELDSKSFKNEGILRSKSNRNFPLDIETKLVRYDADLLKNNIEPPVVFELWPSKTNKGMLVSLEGVVDLSRFKALHNVRIHIKVEPGFQFSTDEISCGTVFVEENEDGYFLIWDIATVDNEDDLSLVFITNDFSTEEELFPVEVTFSSPFTLFDGSIETIHTEKEVLLESNGSTITDGYFIDLE